VARKISGKGEESEERAACGSSKKTKYAEQAPPLPEKNGNPPPSYSEAVADTNQSSNLQLKKASSG